MVKQKTAPSRFSRALRTIAQWCRENRHRPVREQHHTLSQKLRGHFAYYGINVSRCRDSAARCNVSGGNGSAAETVSIGTFGRCLSDSRNVTPYLRWWSSIQCTVVEQMRNLRNRMRELRTSGSVGDLGERSPRSTRLHRSWSPNSGHAADINGDQTVDAACSSSWILGCVLT